MGARTAATYQGDDLVIGTAEPKPAYQVLSEDGSEAINVTGFTFSWMLKRDLEDEDADAIAHIVNADINVTGTFDADPDVNEQRVIPNLLAVHTAGEEPGYVYGELRRTNSGFERVVDKRKFALVRGVHRS